MQLALLIGEATPKYENDDPNDDRLTWGVDLITLPEAPSFPNDFYTLKTNRRVCSSYSWLHFCETTEIKEVFYTSEGNIRGGHPGIFRFGKRELAKVNTQRRTYQAENPTMIPGFISVDSLNKTNYDHYLARLEWLVWWMHWAIQHCKIPAIENKLSEPV